MRVNAFIGSTARFGGRRFVAERLYPHPEYVMYEKVLSQFESQLNRIDNERNASDKAGDVEKVTQLTATYDKVLEQLHQYMNRTTLKQYDIGLIKLKTRVIPVSNHTHWIVNSICLPKKGFTHQKNETVVTIGMGNIGSRWQPSQSEMSHRLKYAVETIWGIEDIKGWFRINLNFISDIIPKIGIFSYKSKYAFCAANLGSPHFQYVGCRAVVIGVSSWMCPSSTIQVVPDKAYCGDKYPNGNTLVALHMDWIRSVIGSPVYENSGKYVVSVVAFFVSLFAFVISTAFAICKFYH